ncbi:hypothetical protein ACFSJ3_04395 [Corallincola platygyrae]|uniref:Transmembrane protein n=1 Tax=Corallincola platygyrae TaxID=1193278 RepID=A0ABW4XJH1_9GAMM
MNTTPANRQLTMTHYLRLALLVALLIAGVIWLLLDLRPRVEVVNEGEKALTRINFSLPDSKLSFDSVEANSQQRIFHMPSKAKGAARFHLVFSDGEERYGRCGTLKEGEWATVTRLKVDALGSVACEVL